ncbi:MAG: hypothetical protein ACD_73C00680G0002 [uncultured bacterium]|nr:MAG: hypothetical protein ACD_73C00680G0002 [uncultured bacterium]
MNIGAGRVVYSGLSQIYQAIEEGSFYQNPSLKHAFESALQNKSRLHLMGLLSDGAVHSHQDHLYALLEMAKKEGVQDVFIHCFLDGRDTPPSSGLKYVLALENKIRELGIGQIASIAGRFYAMDRDIHWDRIEKAYLALVGLDVPGGVSAQSLIEKSYQSGITDEFIVPQSVLSNHGSPVGSIKDNDAIIFFNFRADRAREITRALTDAKFDHFERKNYPKLSAYVCMAPYDETFDLPVAFEPSYPENTLGEILSKEGLTQLRIAETEKYAHVTFFFNGGREKKIAGEDRALIASPREVATYDLKPEMSALKITEELKKRLAEKSYNVVILNFANTDMVGHTAIEPAIIKACETVDACLGEITKLYLQNNGTLLITADHGNAEQTVDEKGEPHTAHTINPVPFMLVSNDLKQIHLKPQGGRLCDIAPTILEILKIKKPKEMTGVSLISS